MNENRREKPIGRRELLGGAAALAGAGFPAWFLAEADRPVITGGVQSGDVLGDRAIVWSRCDRPARLVVEWDTTDRFANPRRVVGPAALESSDFTARVDLGGLPAGQTIFYRASFQDLSDVRTYSEPAAGRLRTPPAGKRDVLFAFGGDTAGQGWGIDPNRGGMGCYETIRRHDPDFFIHSGDNIYADNPIKAEVRLPDGTTWKNVTTEEKSKVAETLDEFRGAFRYNLLDANVRRFNAEVPLVAQWDDHEVRNNWYPGRRLDDNPDYKRVKSCDLLAARAKRAFLDYTPTRFDPQDPERIYRAFHYGPLLDVFMLDERSYRGPNSPNRQARYDPESYFLGPDQLSWIKARLLASRAAWKVIASDQPIGLRVGDQGGTFEAWANGDGPSLGRELEMAELLRFIRDHRIRNIVWVTADVHYAAAHYYNPARAKFTEFHPFWEFVAGPLHAGTFGPDALDDTFGPEVKFNSVQRGHKWMHGPDEENQFFGTARIDGKTEVMTVSLWNRGGKRLYSVDLPPERR